MPPRRSPLTVLSSETEKELVSDFANVLKKLSQKATGHHFIVGLSGGSMIKLFTKALTECDLDTSTWMFFLCDERHVPVNSPDSNYGAYHAEWKKSHPHIRETQLFAMDTSRKLESCAADYEESIRTEVPAVNDIPQFDLLLLGMGPDGHTCSLFPDDTEALNENSRLVIPIRNSPKPPAKRISFSLPLINNTRDVIFVITGIEKADTVKDVFASVIQEYPAALVDPVDGNITLLVDWKAGRYIESLE
ncbi:hypothetical protein KR018_008692 [Drosophila ironensis]|nr:hypothetical protein KR018_008692 [Drosophila ironensis]